MRQRKNAAVKRAFFEAASALFREKGYDATSVDDIAERAGFSRATFFNHFGTKENVLRYYLRFFAGRAERLLDELDLQVSPLNRIRQALAAMVDEAERHREELKLVYRYRGKDPNYLDAFAEAQQGVHERVTGLVDQAQRCGEMRRDLPARELAHHILSVYTGLVGAVIHSGIPSDQTFQSGWRFILAGARESGASENKGRHSDET